VRQFEIWNQKFGIFVFSRQKYKKRMELSALSLRTVILNLLKNHRHCEERGTSNAAISNHWLEIASLNPLAMTAGVRVVMLSLSKHCGVGFSLLKPFDKLRVTAHRIAQKLERKTQL
jgi:hypothetical protein